MSIAKVGMEKTYTWKGIFLLYQALLEKLSTLMEKRLNLGIMKLKTGVFPNPKTKDQDQQAILLRLFGKNPRMLDLG